jgi:putative ATP-dependent endonuclease of the OLD family
MSLPRVTLLIGMNNSGKTSVLKALQLALGDYSRYLSEEDFYIGSDDKRAAEIVVDVRIVPVDKQGDRIDKFDEAWQAEFEDRIQSEANFRQYVALRTRSKPDKGSFDTAYSVLREWTDDNNWYEARFEANKKFLRLNGIQFIPIDAQRDIHQEIGEKSSLVRRVLSNIKYSKTEVDALEDLINVLNDQAIAKSSELATLKTNLENLNQSFESSGKAEITPFPRKIRDLSKYFSAHFGDHGMGTRSWASMLIVNAFAELKKKEYEKDEKLFFPILAAEEPEAHLHPNAQKTLYQQLEKFEGQVIISTHSPYIAAMAKQNGLRYLKRTADGIAVKHLSADLDQEERRRLQREVIHSRGEILFSKALVLSEGETEEQALPLLFKKYCGSEAFVKGVSFIGVGGKGKKYFPFLRFAKDFDMPVFIFSDGEPKTVEELKEIYRKVYGETDVLNSPNITILDNDNFEGYLTSCGFIEVIESVICQQEGDNAIEDWMSDRQGKKDKKDRPPKDYTGNDGRKKAVKEILDKGKAKYAPLIAEKLCELEKEQLPPKILEFFQKLENGGII